MKLNIYDPVRAEMLEDIVYRLLDKDEKCTTMLRIEAMSQIQKLREVLRTVAPPGTHQYEIVRGRLLPDQFKMVYWDEYAAEQYRKIEEAKKIAVDYIGA